MYKVITKKTNSFLLPCTILTLELLAKSTSFTPNFILLNEAILSPIIPAKAINFATGYLVKLLKYT